MRAVSWMRWTTEARAGVSGSVAARSSTSLRYWPVYASDTTALRARFTSPLASSCPHSLLRKVA